jgi:hypothetical protein
MVFPYPLSIALISMFFRIFSKLYRFETGAFKTRCVLPVAGYRESFQETPTFFHITRNKNGSPPSQNPQPKTR